jgi:hypothetical protein
MVGRLVRPATTVAGARAGCHVETRPRRWWHGLVLVLVLVLVLQHQLSRLVGVVSVRRLRSGRAPPKGRPQRGVSTPIEAKWRAATASAATRRVVVQ